MSPAFIGIIAFIVGVIGFLWWVSDEYDSNGGGCGLLICVVGVLVVFMAMTGAFTPAPPKPKTAAEVAQQKAKDMHDAEVAAKKADVQARLDRGESVQVTTAPDGTRLWMAKNPEGEVVYFTAAGPARVRQ